MAKHVELNDVSTPALIRAAHNAVRLARVEPGVMWPPSMPK